jgi:glycosyltransferase involved in cell wall biosynthesis
MSKILFLANAHYDNAKRGTPLHLCHVFRELRKEHDVRICAASVPEEFKDIFIPYPQTRRLRKLLDLSAIMRTYRPDYIFTATSGGLLPPVILKLIFGVKIAEEIHGMAFEELYADGTIGKFGYVLMKWKVWALLHFYNVVFVMSGKLIDYYAPMSKGWVLAYGAVDADEVPDASERIQDGQKLIIGYMGNARAYQGLPFLIEAAADLKARGIQLRLNLIISGDRIKLQELLDQYELTDLATIHHNVSHEEAYRLITDSSVLVIPRASSPITEYVFPGKLADYLATGIPTITTRVGAVDELQQEFSTRCVVIEPDHIASGLADALMQVNGMTGAQRRALGARARAYARERFSWDARGKIFNAEFRS